MTISRCMVAAAVAAFLLGAALPVGAAPVSLAGPEGPEP